MKVAASPCISVPQCTVASPGVHGMPSYLLGSFQPATARFCHPQWLLTLCTGCPVLLLATLLTLHALLHFHTLIPGCLALPQMCPACYAHAQVTLQHLRQHISPASACLMGNSFLGFTVMPLQVTSWHNIHLCFILQDPG